LTTPSSGPLSTGRQYLCCNTSLVGTFDTLPNSDVGHDVADLDLTITTLLSGRKCVSCPAHLTCSPRCCGRSTPKQWARAIQWQVLPAQILPTLRLATALQTDNHVVQVDLRQTSLATMVLSRQRSTRLVSAKVLGNYVIPVGKHGVAQSGAQCFN
jgi:hypothetical protein